MGTRGFVTFVIDGTEKTAYCHADAYPEHVGRDVLNWLHAAVSPLDQLRARARRLRVVTPDTAPTREDFESLHRYAGDRDRARSDWYWLLHGTQGSPGQILQAGVILHAAGLPREPQARWGYVIDLDAARFEVYRGGQQEPHQRGRFASLEPMDIGGHVFYPVALAASWPFGDLPKSGDFIEASYADGG